jgi:pimeloyl-ACP methyl ester carboxylesterase
MSRRWFLASIWSCLLVLTFQAAQSATASLESIKTPRGATQKFILLKPEKPVAAVILFAGGKGALRLKSASKMGWGRNNFLVRSRATFAAHGLVVAVIDAPSDKRKRMNAIFRMSKAHADDISAVAAYLKKQTGLPVWLIGTSMGTFSAANGAIRAKNIHGLVLTSTVTRARSRWKIASSHRNGVASMPLQKVTAPTLIVSHKSDGCKITPAADAPKLQARLTNAAKVEVVMLNGGKSPESEPCKAKSQHGFFGIEDQAVGAIAKFIKANLN